MTIQLPWHSPVAMHLIEYCRGQGVWGVLGGIGNKKLLRNFADKGPAFLNISDPHPTKCWVVQSSSLDRQGLAISKLAIPSMDSESDSESEVLEDRESLDHPESLEHDMRNQSASMLGWGIEPKESAFQVSVALWRSAGWDGKLLYTYVYSDRVCIRVRGLHLVFFQTVDGSG